MKDDLRIRLLSLILTFVQIAGAAVFALAAMKTASADPEALGTAVTQPESVNNAIFEPCEVPVLKVYEDWNLPKGFRLADGILAEDCGEEAQEILDAFNMALTMLAAHRFDYSWTQFQKAETAILALTYQTPYEVVLNQCELFCALIEFMTGQTLMPLFRLSNVEEWLIRTVPLEPVPAEIRLLHAELSSCIYSQINRFDLAFTSLQEAYEAFDEIDPIPIPLQLLLAEAEYRYDRSEIHRSEYAERILELVCEWEAETAPGEWFDFWKALIMTRAIEMDLTAGKEKEAAAGLSKLLDSGLMDGTWADAESRLLITVRLEHLRSEYERVVVKDPAAQRKHLIAAADAAGALVALCPEDLYIEDLYSSLAIGELYQLARYYENAGWDDAEAVTLESLFDYTDLDIVAFDTYFSGCCAMKMASAVNARLEREAVSGMNDLIDFYWNRFHEDFSKNLLPFPMPKPDEVTDVENRKDDVSQEGR